MVPHGCNILLELLNSLDGEFYSGEILRFHHVCVQLLSHVQLFATPWTVAFQVPQSMECWSRLLFAPPEELPNPGIKPISAVSPALAGRFFTTSAIWEASDFTMHDI